MASQSTETADFNDLELTISGVTRTFAEWTEDFVDRYYPDLHQRCYRVPALHFNQQLLYTKGVIAHGEGALLEKPTLQGDLAHTVVVEHFERLGHHLQEHHGAPLFIISSLDFDNYLAKIPKPQTPRKKQKHEAVSTGQDRKEPSTTGGVGGEGGGGGGGGGGGEHGPQQPPRAGQRGEIDVVILSQKWGVILVEVKSTMSPYSKWKNSREEIRRRVQHAMKQVEESNRLFHKIMPDLSCLPQCVTLVVALPYISRQDLQQVLSELDEDHSDTKVVFICKDDFNGKDPHLGIAADTHKYHGISDNTAASGGVYAAHAPPLYDWWQNVMGEGKRPLPLKDMRTIVGRVCGLLSIVRVWTWTKPRVEVRTAAQAISQVGECFSQVVLTPTQTAILADKTSTHVVVSGPMGSGKTLLLQLKGKELVREDKRVVILNVRNVAKGRPIGYLLEKALTRHRDEVQSGSVERCDVALDDFDLKDFASELEKGGPTEDICFLLEELTRSTIHLVTLLRGQFPKARVWCTNMNCREVPEGFRLYRLTDCLRCPPSVQLLLKELDLNPLNKGAYTTRSAVRGLPCDGPPSIFVFHKDHDTGGPVSDCVQCADRLVDILHDLGLVFPNGDQAQDQKPAVTPIHARKATSVDAAALTFSDVLFLYSIPPTYYKQVRENIWELDTATMVKCILYLVRCKFLARLTEKGVPMNFAVEVTSEKIAFPEKDQMTIADVLSVPSLERKVVIFMAGVDTAIDREADSKAINLAVKFLQNTFGRNEGNQNGGEGEYDTSIEDAAVDMMHTLITIHKSKFALKQFTNATKENVRELTKAIFREVKIKIHPQSKPDSEDNSGVKIRKAMEVRGDSPEFPTGLSRQEMTGASHNRTSSLKNGQLDISSQSLFSMPDCDPEESYSDPQNCPKGENHAKQVRKGEGFNNAAPGSKDEERGDTFCEQMADEKDETIKNNTVKQEGNGTEDKQGNLNTENEKLKMDTLRKAELCRIRQAMSSLSMDDQDHVFLAASRCLSQFITFIH